MFDEFTLKLLNFIISSDCLNLMRKNSGFNKLDGLDQRKPPTDFALKRGLHSTPISTK